MTGFVAGVRLVRRRLTDVPFACIVALGGINIAVLAFTRPGRLPAHQLLAPWDSLWAGMYGAGGLLILAGIATARANLEAAGCIAFAGGALVSVVATAVVLRWSGATNVAVLAAYAGLALVRAQHLRQGRVLVLVDVPRSSTGEKRR